MKSKDPVKNFFNSKFLFYFLIILFIVIFVSLIKAANQRSLLKKQSDYYDEKIKEINDQNLDLETQIKIAKTKYFKEKAARTQFGLQKPGERVIILTEKSLEDKKENESYLKKKFSNLRSWWDHFFK